MIKFMIFVIFMYVLYKSGILKTLMSLISTVAISLLSYFIILKPLFQRFENLKFYLFVAIAVLIGIAYVLYQLSVFASNLKGKNQDEQDD